MPSSSMWFTGSSTEGLPFIHDSFRANHKAVHHKPKHPRHPHPDKTAGLQNGITTTSGTLNHKDISKEVLDSESFKLPTVETHTSSNGPLTSRSTGRGDNGKEPVSFTSYMHRYKACARLKGISPSRAYCSTRTRASHLEPSQHDTDHPQPQSSAKDSLHTAAVPLSNLRLDPKANHLKAAATDPVPSESSPSELPEQAAGNNSTAVSGAEEPSLLERQVEEKLKRGSSQDDGMTVSGHHSGRQHRKRGRRSGGTKGVNENGRVTGRGAGPGGGRPLGDIVSSQRLQELLNHQDDRTLPYTYYRTAVGQDEPQLENADIESLN